MENYYLQIGTFIFNMTGVVVLAIIGFFVKNYIRHDESTKRTLFDKLDETNKASQKNGAEIQVIHSTLNTHKEHITKIQTLQNKDHEVLIGLSKNV